MDQFKAPNLYQPANLRAALKTGKTLLGVAISFPSTEVAKKVALSGYDYAFIDAEHAPFTPALLADIVQSVSFYSQGRMIPVVRVPSQEPSFVTVALDAGAAGIVLPHTETREQAQGLIDMCKFPPQGHRSYPPWAWIPGVTDQAPEGQTVGSLSNEHIACIAQIESVRGAENAEAIMSLEGIDAVMIGVGDLRMSMNLPLDWFGNEPEYIERLRKIEELSYRYKKPLAGFAFPEMVTVWEERIRRGYKMLTCAADLYALVHGLAKSKQASVSSVATIQATMAKERKVVVSEKKQTNKADGRPVKISKTQPSEKPPANDAVVLEGVSFAEWMKLHEG